jgi:hypothetical protein
MWDQWFAWRPVKSAKSVIWLDWVWRLRDSGPTRYFPCY